MSYKLRFNQCCHAQPILSCQQLHSFHFNSVTLHSVPFISAASSSAAAYCLGSPAGRNRLRGVMVFVSPQLPMLQQKTTPPLVLKKHRSTAPSFHNVSLQAKLFPTGCSTRSGSHLSYGRNPFHSLQPSPHRSSRQFYPLRLSCHHTGIHFHKLKKQYSINLN